MAPWPFLPVGRQHQAPPLCIQTTLICYTASLSVSVSHPSSTSITRHKSAYRMPWFRLVDTYLGCPRRQFQSLPHGIARVRSGQVRSRNKSPPPMSSPAKSTQVPDLSMQGLEPPLAAPVFDSLPLCRSRSRGQLSHGELISDSPPSQNHQDTTWSPAFRQRHSTSCSRPMETIRHRQMFCSPVSHCPFVHYRPVP
ncbi:uncharacterized protein J3D65DRAFT_11729 [Phyllosticta citribraziliensis]|uniref:Uncharacterized protein n=1 Tax=Phyllosticta citribraziliensis TaxID=989973 RepID=A0ABR1MAB7_9PEZI